MGVGGIRGGGGKGRARGPGGPSGSEPAQKTGAKAFNEKVGKTKPTEAASRTSAPSGPGSVGPLSTHAQELARKLRSGEIGTKEEATRQLVTDILEEKLPLQSKALASRIADALLDDPRLNKALDRLWSKEG